MPLLAFDSSTDHLSIAVQHGAQVWLYDGPGGAQASATLVPHILALLGHAGLALPELQAVVFGQGPGSFTGLRTACAIAQGLAWGAGVPVLPVPPSCRAKYATGKGNAGKDEVLLAVARRYPHAPVGGNDEADALVLAAMGARLLGEPVEDSLPKAHLDALAKLALPTSGP